MYAIIRTGDKQFRVQPGSTIRVPALAAEVGETVTFDEVLLASADGNVRIGAPVIEGAAVTGEVVAHGKGEKIIVFRYRNKKRYRRRTGHRQRYTQIKISEIVA